MMNHPVLKGYSKQQNQSNILSMQLILGTLHCVGFLYMQCFEIWSPFIIRSKENRSSYSSEPSEM